MVMKKISHPYMITDNISDLKACVSKVERLSNCIEIANLINSELSIGKLLSNVMETTKEGITGAVDKFTETQVQSDDLTLMVFGTD
jgi:hypothetical protein